MSAQFVFTGGMQTYEVERSGVYAIEAVGASGSGGNTFAGGVIAQGGKGAKVRAEFSLAVGERIHILVGEQGSCVQAAAKDGTAGGGGGATFVFKEVAEIKDTKYEFEKNGTHYVALLVAAGGGGSEDASYRGRNSTGRNGLGATPYTPLNYAPYASQTMPQTGQTNTCMGIEQFIRQNGNGCRYTRNGGVSQGGYGCGSAADDGYSWGGGWAVDEKNTSACSWSLGANTVGEDGVNEGDGFCKIEALSLNAGIRGKEDLQVSLAGRWHRVKRIFILHPKGEERTWRSVTNIMATIGGLWKKVFPAADKTIAYFAKSEENGKISSLLEPGRLVSAARAEGKLYFSHGYFDYNYSQKVAAFDRSLVRTVPHEMVGAAYVFAGASTGSYAVFCNGYNRYAYDAQGNRITLPEGNDYAKLAVASHTNRAFFVDGSRNTGECFDEKLVRTTIGKLRFSSETLAGAICGEYALFGGGWNKIEAFSQNGVRKAELSVETSTGLTNTVGNHRYAIFHMHHTVLNQNVMHFIDSNLLIKHALLQPYSNGIQAEPTCGASFGTYHVLSGMPAAGSGGNTLMRIWNQDMVEQPPMAMQTGRSQHGIGTVGDYLLLAGGLLDQTGMESKEIEAYCLK